MLGAYAKCALQSPLEMAVWIFGGKKNPHFGAKNIAIVFIASMILTDWKLYFLTSQNVVFVACNRMAKF